MNKIKLALIGANGKLGSIVEDQLKSNNTIEITNKITSKNILELNSNFDILLDVANSQYTDYYFNYCLKHNKKLLLGVQDTLHNN